MLLDKHSDKKHRGEGLGALKNSDKKIYELMRKESKRLEVCEEYHAGQCIALKEADRQVYK